MTSGWRAERAMTSEWCAERAMNVVSVRHLLRLCPSSPALLPRGEGFPSPLSRGERGGGEGEKSRTTCSVNLATRCAMIFNPTLQGAT